jgi:RHS repeat-associated protein
MDETKTVKKRYVYGLDLISQTDVAGTADSQYYGYDGMGSVRILTDETGVTSDNYDYDAFGTLVYSSGSTPNSYLFHGEQFDADLGQYYLRARYMNPEIGRFWTMDEFEGNNEDPSSLHKYNFAAANPINWNDPLGLSIGDLPPPLPGYNSMTWKTGQWENGQWYVTDPETGKTYTMHPEDESHWRHWDDDKGGRWPPNSKKRWPTQKKKNDPDQSDSDPSGDAYEWTPPNTYPFTMYFVGISSCISIQFRFVAFEPIFAWGL